jgi:hypothetical protein
MEGACVLIEMSDVVRQPSLGVTSSAPSDQGQQQTGSDKNGGGVATMYM